MGCGPSRARHYQYEISDDPYAAQNPNATPLQPMGPGPGPRGRCGRRFGPGCHGPPGPFGRRGGCHRRPPWAQQQYMNMPPPPQGYSDNAGNPAAHEFAEEAPIPEGFQEGATLLEKEKERGASGRAFGKGGKGEKESGVYRDQVDNRESVPPRYSSLT